MRIKIGREKIDIERARKKMSVSALAEAYRVSRARINVILNQREVSVVSAGRLAHSKVLFELMIEEGELQQMSTGNNPFLSGTT